MDSAPGASEERILDMMRKALEDSGRLYRQAMEVNQQLRDELRTAKNRIADLEQQNSSLTDRLNEHWPPAYRA